MKILTEVIKNAELSSILNNYIELNDKKLIVSALNVINNNDDYKSRLRKGCKRVFRGLNLDRYVNDYDIITKDLEQLYLACTYDYETAKNYASGESSSFDSDTTIESNNSVIIEYKLNSGGEYLDLEKFKGLITTDKYEPEILINPTNDIKSWEIHRNL